MKKQTVSTIALLVVAVLIVAVLLKQAFEESAPEGVLISSGRIEGRIVTVTPKIAGRVLQIDVDEGGSAAVDGVIAKLDDPALRARVLASEAQIEVLKYRLIATEQQLEVARKQVPLEVAQATEGLREAEARLAQARASLAQAKRDEQRYSNLAADNLASDQDAESHRLKVVEKESGVEVAEAGLARAEKQLALARLGESRLKALVAERDAQAQQVEQANAALKEQYAYLHELTIRSPIGGTVLTRNVEPGELVGPNVPLFTMVNLNRLYLKVYVPEPEVGKIVLGQSARIYVDAYPERHFNARVSKVAQQAEFTPKNVETREERVKLVFAVELSIEENPGGVLKPGMPADAEIDWQNAAP